MKYEIAMIYAQVEDWSFENLSRLISELQSLADYKEEIELEKLLNED